MMEDRPEHGKKKVKTLVAVAFIFWIAGFMMILNAVYQEFWGVFAGFDDSVNSRYLEVFQLGGLGFIFSGIFLSLIAILQILMLIPVNLGKAIKKK